LVHFGLCQASKQLKLNLLHRLEVVHNIHLLNPDSYDCTLW
jgi:hypothetical protein